MLLCLWVLGLFVYKPVHSRSVIPPLSSRLKHIRKYTHTQTHTPTHRQQPGSFIAPCGLFSHSAFSVPWNILFLSLLLKFLSWVIKQNQFIVTLVILEHRINTSGAERLAKLKISEPKLWSSYSLERSLGLLFPDFGDFFMLTISDGAAQLTNVCWQHDRSMNRLCVRMLRVHWELIFLAWNFFFFYHLHKLI